MEGYKTTTKTNIAIILIVVIIMCVVLGSILIPKREHSTSIQETNHKAEMSVDSAPKQIKPELDTKEKNRQPHPTEVLQAETVRLEENEYDPLLGEISIDIVAAVSPANPAPISKPAPNFHESLEIAMILDPLRNRWCKILSMDSDCVVTILDAQGNPARTLAGTIRVKRSGSYTIDASDTATGARYLCNYDGTFCREEFDKERSVSFAPTLPSLVLADILDGSAVQYDTIEQTDLLFLGEDKPRSVQQIISRQAGYRIYIDRSDGSLCRVEKFDINTQKPTWTIDYGDYQQLPDGTVFYTTLRAYAHDMEGRPSDARQIIKLKNLDINNISKEQKTSAD